MSIALLYYDFYLHTHTWFACAAHTECAAIIVKLQSHANAHTHTATKD